MQSTAAAIFDIVISNLFLDQGKGDNLTSITTSDKVTLYLELAEVHRLCGQQVVLLFSILFTLQWE